MLKRSVFANDRLRLSITDGCNFRCGYCTNEGQQSRGGNILPVSFVYDLVDAIKREGIYVRKLNITGGEPLLHPELSEIVVQCASVSESVTLNTNGSCLDPSRIADLHKKGVSNIKIGIDSFKSDSPKPGTRLGRKRVDEILASLLYAKEIMPRSSVNIVLTDYNVQELPAILEYVLFHKVNWVEVLELIEHPFRQKDVTISASLVDVLSANRRFFQQIAYNARLAKFICVTPDGLTVQFAQDFCAMRVCANLWTRISAAGALLPCIKSGEEIPVEFSRSFSQQVTECNKLMCDGTTEYVPRDPKGTLLPTAILSDSTHDRPSPARFRFKDLNFAVVMTDADP